MPRTNRVRIRLVTSEGCWEASSLLMWSSWPYASHLHCYFLHPVPPAPRAATFLSHVFSHFWRDPRPFPWNTPLSPVCSSWKALIEFLGKWMHTEAEKTTKLKSNRCLHFEVSLKFSDHNYSLGNFSHFLCRFLLLPSMELGSPLLSIPFKYPSKSLSQSPEALTSLFELPKAFNF